MDDLDFLAAQKARGAQDEGQLERSDREGGERDSKILGNFRKFASRRPSQPNLMPELEQRVGDADRSIIRSSPEQHRVEVEDAQRHRLKSGPR